MNKLKWILSALILSNLYGCKAQVTNANARQVHVVLLAGQSNMAGAANFEALDSAEIKRIEKVSSRVSLSYNGKPAKPLSYYENKPSEKYNFLKRFGPEIFIGLTLAENNPNQEYLLIKRSQGGTALYGAWNPNWTAEKAKAVEKAKKQNIQLYAMHIEDIKANLKVLKNQGKSYKIIGLAWMQGENDAVLEVAAKQYKNNLRALVRAYRKDLYVPELPFVLGQINSRYGVEGGADLVRDNMVKFAYQDYYSDLIKTATDTTWSDYPKHSDNVHYNTEGQKRLGIAFANSFFKIQNKLNVDTFKSVNQLEPGNTIKVKAIGETNMIYNIYTPKSFKKTDKLPILIAFSPGGNGTGILNNLKESAENANWILVGCDKLKNGIKDTILEVKMEDEVMNDILKNIPHHSERIYLAGFSGGAMRAYSLSTRRPEKYAGIIAYGGWLGGKDYQNKAYQEGMYVALINGDKDKGANNWKEIDTKTLLKNNCVVKHFSHNGGHKIAPNKTTTKAIDWLNLEWENK